ncbi:hypothetical protein GCM10027614_82030 [Micromonospora vulcania]
MVLTVGTSSQDTEGADMGQPVVHFEIIGTDPAKLRSYYGDLFGWKFDTSGPVSEAVSEPGNYGFIDPSVSSGGVGIPGGVGGGAGFAAQVTFYVGVPDVEAALQRAESLGGRAGWAVPGAGDEPRGRPLHRPGGPPDRRRRHGVAVRIAGRDPHAVRHDPFPSAVVSPA